MTRLTTILRLLLGLLPSSAAKNLLLNAAGPGWAIARGARIQPNILWRIETFSIGERAQLGFGNVFRDLRRVSIAPDAAIGQLNWISAAAHIFSNTGHDQYRSLTVGDRAGVTSRHYLDCSGGLTIGAQSTIAGVRTTIMTHGPDLRAGRMDVGPVTIGEFCFMSANVVITAGCTIADRIVVGAGSVVTADLEKSDSLYAGVPARHVGAMDDAVYFRRPGLRIDPDSSRPLPDSGDLPSPR